MQVTNHAGHGPSRGTQTAHRDDPLRSPLERAPPRSRAHSPSGGFRPVRGTNPPSSGSAPARGLTPPRASRVSLEGPSRPRPGPATLTGVPHACAGPVHGHLTPWRRGTAPSCARGSRPGAAAPTPQGGAHPRHCGKGLCGTAGVSPVTPRAHYSTANAPDPRRGAGRTLDFTFP
jgi:hypothetical protein